jgi:hypothetical protein
MHNLDFGSWRPNVCADSDITAPNGSARYVRIVTRRLAMRRRCGFWPPEFLARRKNEGH